MFWSPEQLGEVVAAAEAQGQEQAAGEASGGDGGSGELLELEAWLEGRAESSDVVAELLQQLQQARSEGAADAAAAVQAASGEQSQSGSQPSSGGGGVPMHPLLMSDMLIQAEGEAGSASERSASDEE